MAEHPMNRLQRVWDEKANEYAGLVREGLITAEVAAACLAGADLKERQAIYEDTGKKPGPGGNIKVAQQAIDSRLPGYKGLVAGRHV